jgi:hypothetical protein
MLLASPANGLFLGPKEIFAGSGWRRFASLPKPVRIEASNQILSSSAPEATQLMSALGWSEDQYRLLFRPLVEAGQETVWSMGDDAAPAFISSLGRPLWDHCKQRFAQVTNPPIDPLRETHVMSLNVFLDPSTVLASPLVDPAQLRVIQRKLSPVERLDFTFPVADGIESGKRALDQLEERARAVANKNVRLVLLSDRAAGVRRSALPALLAVAAAWKGMVKAGAWDVPLIIETGQVIDTHHVALLIAAGASAVVPYIALQQAAAVKPDGVATYRRAIEKGLLKVMARMGVYFEEEVRRRYPEFPTRRGEFGWEDYLPPLSPGLQELAARYEAEERAPAAMAG